MLGCSAEPGPSRQHTNQLTPTPTELALNEINQAAATATATAGSAVLALLDDLQSDWRQRIAWVDSRPSGLPASHMLFQEMVAHARVLYTAYPPLAKAIGPSHASALKLVRMADWLTAGLSPVLREGWPLPERLEMVVALEEARAAAVAAGAPAVAAAEEEGSGGGAGGGGGGEPQPLASMQQLMDFLPSTGGGGGGKGGSKSKGKKSKSVKK